MGWPLRGGRGVDSCFTADQRRCFGGGDGWPLRGRRGVDWRFAADQRRCFGGGEGWPLRGGRGVGSGVAAVQLCGFAAVRRYSPGERERARRPSRASIEPGGVYAGFAAISSQGSLPPGEEIASLQFPRPEIRRISAETV